MDGEAYARYREQLLTGTIDPATGKTAQAEIPDDPATAPPAAPANEPEPPATPAADDPAAAAATDDDLSATPGKGFRPRLDALPDTEKEAIALRKQLAASGKDVSLKDCITRVEAKYGVTETPDPNAPAPTATAILEPEAIRARIAQLETDEVKAGEDADTVGLARIAKELRTAEKELTTAETAIAQAEQKFEADMQQSISKARTLYPSLKDESTPLAKQWHAIMARLQENNDPLLTSGNANVPLIVTQMAAAELGVAPVDVSKAPPAKASPPVPPIPQKQPAQVQLTPGSARSSAPSNPTEQLAAEMANITSMDDWEAFKAKALG